MITKKIFGWIGTLQKNPVEMASTRLTSTHSKKASKEEDVQAKEDELTPRNKFDGVAKVV